MQEPEHRRWHLPLFAVAAGDRFAERMARTLLEAAETPEALARMLLILPGRRAVQAMTDALLRAGGGRALLLPRLVPVGDLGESGALDTLLAGLGEEAAMPPAIGSLHRQLQLATTLAGAGVARGGRAFALAAELAGALDELAIAQVPLERLRTAAVELAAGHWARNREILELLARAWPELAREAGGMDPIERRERELALLARHWDTAPPEHPVVMAGFASAPPAVRRLMKSVLALPRGRVVLAGFDPGLDAAGWAELAEAAASPARRGDAEMHPQHGIAGILADLGASPVDIRLLDAAEAAMPGRRQVIAAAVAPAALPRPGAMARADGSAEPIRLIEAETLHEEALAIALAIRETLESPGRTAMLVTSDRQLARRVAGQLRRFDLIVDDSAGTPLRLTAHGRLMAALAAAAATGLAPVPLVSVVRHPMLAEAREGDARQLWRDAGIALDRVLRGVRPAAGPAGIRDRIRAAGDKRLLQWWETEAAPILTPLDRLLAGGGATDLPSFLGALRAAAAALVPDAIWAGAEGHALAALLEEAEAGPRLALTAADAPAIVDALLETRVIRPQFGLHPRLSILGPVEARLAGADLTILGGMNEGQWPAPADSDPWLAPALRRALALASAQARIGLQAQDFLSLASASGALLITRARRSETGPESPSRFLEKLRVAAGGLLVADGQLLALARSLDRPAAVIPARRPAPQPPAAARPRRLGASAIDMLAADPFSFYARDIVGLAPLEPLDADPAATDRGTAVHAILEGWLGKGGDRETLTEAALMALGGGPGIRLLWRPRLERMLDAVEAMLASDRADGWLPIAFEVRGRLDLGGIELNGTADRIDQRGPELRIIDYKTGGVPTRAQAVEGYALQLPALSLIARSGGFPGVPARAADTLVYVRLSGGMSGGDKEEGARWPWDLAAAEERLREVTGGYLAGNRAFRAKEHHIYSERYRSYDHFARLAEWFGRDGLAARQASDA